MAAKVKGQITKSKKKLGVVQTP